MKPDASHALERVMQSLLGDLMPNVQPSYRQASVLIHAMMIGAIREELDRAAARRVEENRALRALFAEAAPAVADAALRERLAAAAAAGDDSLLVPALEEGNRALRSLLIELHAHVEGLAGGDARRIEAAIWRELAASTERRKLSLGPC
jgi:hypothetical protein